MASSRPSAFILDDDDDWGSFTPLSSSLSRAPAPLSSRSSVSSGEFNVNAFSTVGAVIAGGGGGAKREIWIFEGSKRPCLGKVGNAKFCVKECERDTTFCGTGRHVSKFSVNKDGAYIHVTENQVYCDPCLDLSVLFEGQRAKLMSMTQTAADWDRDIKNISKGQFPAWLENNDSTEKVHVLDAEDQASLNLLSPMASEVKQGIFEMFPSFSFESETSNDSKEGSEEFEENETLLRISKLEKRLLQLRAKLTRPFTDIEASYTVLISDIQRIHGRLKSVMTMMGTAQTSDGTGYSTVWSALQGLSEKVKMLFDSRS
jgi:hypothetical protein